MIGKIKIDGVEKEHVGRMRVDWDVNTLDSFIARLRVAEDLAGYVETTIERDDVEIFGGRVQTPRIHFGALGTGMTVEGYDYTIMLQDFLTPFQSIEDESTEDALNLVLTNWPHSVSIDGTFAYISELEDWQTSLEFLMEIELYTDTCIEFDITEPEINNEFREGTVQSYGAGGLHNCFFYDGATQRFYIFYREGNMLCYDHSVDGVTWTRVATPINCTTNRFSVAWHSDKVYLFIEAPGGDTEFYRGPIDDGTGGITLTPISALFANPMRFGPVWDNEGHIWVVEEVANGQAWESTTDGAGWVAKFVGPANHNLWGVLPRRAVYGAGDMFAFVLNDNDDDLEEWLWDKSVPSFTRTQKICDTTGDIDALQAATTHWHYHPWVCFRDGTNIYVYSRTSGASGVWSSRYSGTVGNYDGSFSFCHDAGEAAYLILSRAAGSIAIKMGGVGGDDTWTVTSDYVWHVAGTVFGGSNPFAEEGDLGVFFCAIDTDDDDGWFILFPPTGIRLHEFHATGSFRSDSVTTSGIRWGLLNSENVEVLADWSILDNANALLLDGIETTYDLHEGGLDPAENVVKVKCDLYRRVAQPPYVVSFAISERLDEVTMDTDYEDCYIGVQRLADLAGAEFWVEKADSVYTLYFSTRRGSDKSNLVVLKSAKTADYPTVKPNIKFLEKTFDWDRYGNCIKVIGGTVDGVRVEAAVKDPTEIAAFGQEVWKTIRNADIITVNMAVQRGYIELLSRNAVSLRITGRFLDEYDPKDIEIGDSVTLVAEWDDGDLKILGSHRIIQLSREYSADGELVDASFSNQMKSAEYWAYMSKTDTLERWLTA